MAPEARLEQNPALGRKLWWLILGRLVVAHLLLAVSYWTGNTTGLELWPKALPVLGFVASLTVPIPSLTASQRTRLFQVRLQFAVDIALVTWLVWSSDVVQSSLHRPVHRLHLDREPLPDIAGSDLYFRRLCVAFTACALGRT
jgi:hypothetical protein